MFSQSPSLAPLAPAEHDDAEQYCHDGASSSGGSGSCGGGSPPSTPVPPNNRSVANANRAKAKINPVAENASGEEGAFPCQWAKCAARFRRLGDLVVHINKEHCGADRPWPNNYNAHVKSKHSKPSLAPIVIEFDVTEVPLPPNGNGHTPIVRNQYTKQRDSSAGPTSTAASRKRKSTVARDAANKAAAATAATNTAAATGTPGGGAGTPDDKLERTGRPGRPRRRPRERDGSPSPRRPAKSRRTTSAASASAATRSRDGSGSLGSIPRRDGTDSPSGSGRRMTRSQRTSALVALDYSLPARPSRNGVAKLLKKYRLVVKELDHKLRYLEAMHRELKQAQEFRETAAAGQVGRMGGRAVGVGLASPAPSDSDGDNDGESSFAAAKGAGNDLILQVEAMQQAIETALARIMDEVMPALESHLQRQKDEKHGPSGPSASVSEAGDDDEEETKANDNDNEEYGEEEEEGEGEDEEEAEDEEEEEHDDRENGAPQFNVPSPSLRAACTESPMSSAPSSPASPGNILPTPASPSSTRIPPFLLDPASFRGVRHDLVNDDLDKMFTCPPANANSASACLISSAASLLAKASSPSRYGARESGLRSAIPSPVPFHHKQLVDLRHQLRDDEDPRLYTPPLSPTLTATAAAANE